MKSFLHFCMALKGFTFLGCQGSFVPDDGLVDCSILETGGADASCSPVCSTSFCTTNKWDLKINMASGVLFAFKSLV